MIEVSLLDWFLIHTLPIMTEKSVIEINNCRSNQIVSKKLVVVIGIYLDGMSAREFYTKFIHFVKFGVTYVHLIIFLLVENLLSALYD